MARFWVDPTRGGALVALCDRCATEEKTARAVREQEWAGAGVEGSLSLPPAGAGGRVVLRGVRGAA